MGSLFSRCQHHELEKEEEEAPAGKQEYSWDTRKKVDPKDFTIENLKGETVGRAPGTVNGQQFIIQNCEDCNIYIFDHSNTISVDDCKNCNIFLGPIKTSVFVRDCSDCKMMIACQQFRTRDCKKLNMFLSCVTQPIIEASTGMKFACFQYHYPELESQFKQADLSVYNNNWSNIHDFTPVPGENNYSLLPEDFKVEEYLPVPKAEQFASMQISTDRDQSVVPNTQGMRRKKSNESCLVVFFSDGLSHDRANNFMTSIKQEHQFGVVLVQSKEVTMQPADAQRIFGTDNYALAVRQGPVIGFEYSGDGALAACQSVCVAVSKGSTGLVFVSNNLEAAAQHIEAFYNCCDIQMAV